MKQQTKTELTKELAEDIASAIRDDVPVEEMRESFRLHPSALWSLMGQSVLAPERSPELEIIRSAILDVLLKDSVIENAMQAITGDFTSEKHSVKVTRLINLSTQEKAALKKEGYVEFLKNYQTAPITLKIEETHDIIPRDNKILSQLLGIVAGNIKPEDIRKQIVSAAEIDPELDAEI